MLFESNEDQMMANPNEARMIRDVNLRHFGIEKQQIAQLKT